MTRTQLAALMVLTTTLAACQNRDEAKASTDAAPAQGAAAATAADNDLFAFAAGARFVAIPDGDSLADLNYGPINLIDESLYSDWTGEAARATIFVLELAGRTEIRRIGFDSGKLNRVEKTPRSVRVEVSDTSATTGFVPALETELQMGLDGQDFTLPRPVTGRWVRLTLTGAHGDDYMGLTGWRGYGRALSQDATSPDVSGAYEGRSGWGRVHLKQEGSRVVGCYEYRNGVLSGGVEGGLVKVEMIEQVHGGGTERQLGLFVATPQAVYGLTRVEGGNPEYGYSAFYSGDKVSDDIGDCPAIPGYRQGGAAGSQLATQLETAGRARLDGINFDFNAATLQPASHALLDQVAQMLKTHPTWKVVLEGHTDGVGGEAFNQGLSDRRAEAVKAYLVGAGVAADRLTATGFGMTRPVASNDTQGGRAQNRRVEIVKSE